ncbi:MAG: hypothetical protein WCC92_20115 [Candidatus Korobacteraceae bacterium]
MSGWRREGCRINASPDLNTLFPASASLFATMANKINERGQISGMAIDCCDVSSDHVSAIACAASITWPRSFAKLLDSMQEAASSCGDAKQGPDSAGDQLLGQGDLAHQNSRKALVLLSSDTADDQQRKDGIKASTEAKLLQLDDEP